MRLLLALGLLVATARESRMGVSLKISWSGQTVFVRGDIPDKNAYRCTYTVTAQLADGNVATVNGRSEPRGSGTNLQVGDYTFVATVRSASLSKENCTLKG